MAAASSAGGASSAPWGGAPVTEEQAPHNSAQAAKAIGRDRCRLMSGSLSEVVPGKKVELGRSPSPTRRVSLGRTDRDRREQETATRTRPARPAPAASQPSWSQGAATSLLHPRASQTL